jgi:hypothetical protein
VLVKSYENQKVEIGLKIKAMVDEGGSADRKKIKMEWIIELLADEQSRLVVLRGDFELVETIVKMAQAK